MTFIYRNDQRRARNVSGSRPISSLSEPLNPLEQLLHSGQEELSYGNLLKPSDAKFTGQGKSATCGNCLLGISITSSNANANLDDQEKLRKLKEIAYHTSRLHAGSSEFLTKHSFVQR